MPLRDLDPVLPRGGAGGGHVRPGYNPFTPQYEATRIASTQTIRIPEAGRFDEAANRFELKADYLFAGETWRQRTVIEPLPPDCMKAIRYWRFGSVPGWKGVEILYTRRAVRRPGAGP